MKKFLLLLAAFGFMLSCTNEKDLYQPVQEGVLKDYNLVNKINVTSDLPDNTRCLLYTINPEGEGNAAEPIMVAYAPFNLDIPVAKAVDKLYVYVNGAINVYERGDITINSSSFTINSTGFTRAEGDETPGSKTQVALSAPFVTAINNYYPEALVNVFNGDLKTSSDLIAYDGPKEIIEHPDGSITEITWETTKVWITYITDGGCNFSGSLWYYTYQVDESGTPTTPLNNLTYVQIFDNAVRTGQFPNGPGSKVYLGEFKKGTRIGFKYLGNATYNGSAYPKYSTPYYNAKAYAGRTTGGSWSNKYNGQAIKGNCNDYKDNAYTCGVIRIFEYEGKEYATLGMENRLPSENQWDGDFNDMICLIEATPLAVENTIDPPTPDPTKIKFGGYWLFEDNYPQEGDYDFNDLVVKYAITEYPASSAQTVIDLQFMARGAEYSNSFGINKVIYFEKLKGYENVRIEDDAVEQPVHQITVPKAESYIPMLNNGTVDFDLNTYWDNGEPFPCILEIPIYDIKNAKGNVVGQSEFLWCREGKRIDNAYPRYRNWVDSNCQTNLDWFLDAPVAELVWDK